MALDKDGKCEFTLTDYYLPDEDVEFTLGDTGYIYYGYQELDSFIYEHIIPRTEDYNCESNVYAKDKDEAYNIEKNLEYVKSPSQLSDDIREKMDKRLQDYLKMEYVDYYEKLVDVSLEKIFVLSPKNLEDRNDYDGNNCDKDDYDEDDYNEDDYDEDDYDEDDYDEDDYDEDGYDTDVQNYVYFVYNVTARSPETKKKFQYYWYGYYTNVNVMTMQNDMDIVDLNVFRDAEEDGVKAVYYVSRWDSEYCYGFLDMDSFFNTCIARKLSYYECSAENTENGETTEYAVDGSIDYVKTVSDLSEDVLESMDKKLQDINKMEIENYYDDYDISLQDMELKNVYVVSAKENVDVTPHNYVYLFYKMRLKNTEDNKIYDAYYWYGGFENVILLPDGTCSVNLDNYFSVIGDNESQMYQDDGFLYGYYDMDKMIDACVISKSEKYTYTAQKNEK